MLIQAEAGPISITGTLDTPVKTGIPTADIASGMCCAQAVLAAPLRRNRTGEGATLEVSMLEATAEWTGYALYTRKYAGVQPPCMGVNHVSIAPCDAFSAGGGQTLIGVQSKGGSHDVLEAPELADDPRITSNIERVRNRADCDAEVAARTVRWTTAELGARLSAAGIPAAQINDVSQAVDHVQLQSRNRWRTISTEFADVDALLPPVTFEDVEAAMGAVPALGQHTCGLLAESGIGSDTVDDLVARGIAQQSGSHRTAQLH